MDFKLLTRVAGMAMERRAEGRRKRFGVPGAARTRFKDIHRPKPARLMEVLGLYVVVAGRVLHVTLGPARSAQKINATLSRIRRFTLPDRPQHRDRPSTTPPENTDGR